MQSDGDFSMAQRSRDRTLQSTWGFRDAIALNKYPIKAHVYLGYALQDRLMRTHLKGLEENGLTDPIRKMEIGL